MSKRIIPGVVNVQPARSTSPSYADEYKMFTDTVHADVVSWEPDGRMITGPACWGRLGATGQWVRAVNWLSLVAGRYEPCDGPPEADDEDAAQRKAEHFARLFGSSEGERASRMF